MADHNATNPSLRLSSVLLNGTNYISWSRAVSLALGGKQKSGFITGKSACPALNDAKYGEWISTDQLVRSWLLNSMELKVAEIFTFSESAQSLWHEVNELYGNLKNLARIYELKRNIAEAEQADKSFTEHLGDLKKNWDELSVYRPFTTDAKILLKREEEDKICTLLGSLKPEYDSLRSNILMSWNLPTFSNVCATIHQEETRKKAMSFDNRLSSELVEPNVLLANKKHFEKGKNNFVKDRKSVYYCDHCNKKWHTKDRCWQLHPQLKAERYPREHAAIADTSISISQLSRLLQQLNKCETSVRKEEPTATHISGNLHAFLTSCSKINSWIIDSGATDHMVNNQTCVSNFTHMSNKREVSVANGSTVPIKGSKDEDDDW